MEIFKKDTKALQELVEKQETVLRFQHFSYKDAWELGVLMVNEARERKLPIAIRITVNNLVVFSHVLEGANAHNEQWLGRKHNTVFTRQESSLHLFTVAELEGKTLEKDWLLDPMEYALCGGGFPLYLNGTGVIGSICVSGLPHVDDHMFITGCLEKFLGVKVQ
ncbi:heme-degrading domain-containing protein [Zongyangia hominis]|uniref:Heme-degrading domain-containing protein n=1 Tax=Zongyangia hominis TaxID=2763677 RepID=A0A926ED32_9FIRM|nr:heme-degrading domain-containing protein [Zongyangia hominis]MBC8570848.1 heme-degrading domain-containing protein [Zongyangia hominis]